MPAGRLDLPGTVFRSARFRLLCLAALAGAVLAVLGWRITHPAQNATPTSPQPILGANVPIESPPPLPTDDHLSVQAGLRQVRALQAEAKTLGNDPTAHLRAAQAATLVGDLLSARDEIQTAFTLNPQQHPPAIVDVLARCEAQLGLFSEAQATYRDLIARNPNDATGYIGLSRVQYLIGQRPQALQTLETGTRAVPTSNLQGLLALANEFEARAEILRALAEAQAVANAAPTDPAAGVTVARLLSKLGRLQESRTLLEKLLVAHPDDAMALSQLADLRLNPLLPHNDAATVEQTLLLAGQYNPRDPASFLRLGGYYQAQGRFRQAAFVYTRLLKSIPHSAVGRLQLSYAYASLGDRQTAAEQEQIAQRLLDRDKAETLLTTRRDARPTDPQARLALAHHYIGTGQFAKALPELQAAYCLSSGSAPIRRELAAFYQRLGIPPPAEKRGKC